MNTTPNETDFPHARYKPISDYAFLSDCHSTALVSREGSVDWACFRRFDSASAFGRLLDADRGGFFSIRPVEPILAVKRRYRPSTMIVETTMTTASGTIVGADALAMTEGGSSEPRGQLLRTVTAIEGQVLVEVVIEARFDYGSTRPWLRRHPSGQFSAVGGDEALVIAASCQLAPDPRTYRLTGEVLLGSGQELLVTLVSQAAHQVEPGAADVADIHERLSETEAWWLAWSERTTATGPYADVLERSAIVLKGLCCAPTGAVIAAPTTSLPEIEGGGANWDYRYCWIRDATMMLEALSEVGHPEIARGFRDFLLRSSAGHADDLQIMYGAYGEHRLREFELDLEGWRRSAPVRIGNRAANQLQLDVFGHLLDAARLWHDRHNPIDPDEWHFLGDVVDRAAALRNEPDSGIWEIRGGPRHFVHSKVMVWVALDRGISLVEHHGLIDDRADRWRELRHEVRADIETHGVDHERGIFVQAYGSSAIDASLLKLPLAGFVDANDDRMMATTDVIIDQLGIGEHGLLRRYLPDQQDPSETEEGAFLLCSLWLVEVLALQGRLDQARQLFEAVVGLSNDVGLLAEEYSVGGQQMLGNFPQGFTHLGLITAARRLTAGSPKPMSPPAGPRRHSRRA